MNTDYFTTFADGSIEYYSVWSHTTGYHYFRDSDSAVAFIQDANDQITGGVMFHKELDGVSILPSDIAIRELELSK